jgi:hypothetical protein
MVALGRLALAASCGAFSFSSTDRARQAAAGALARHLSAAFFCIVAYVFNLLIQACSQPRGHRDHPRLGTQSSLGDVFSGLVLASAAPIEWMLVRLEGERRVGHRTEWRATHIRRPSGTSPSPNSTSQNPRL